MVVPGDSSHGSSSVAAQKRQGEELGSKITTEESVWENCGLILNFTITVSIDERIEKKKLIRLLLGIIFLRLNV